jgi:hypothetical protein
MSYQKALIICRRKKEEQRGAYKHVGKGKGTGKESNYRPG